MSGFGNPPRKPNCAECGHPFETTRREARFCSNECRQDFNRRRRDRGAELYDFYMAGELDTCKRLADAYRAGDQAKRAGRPSWQPQSLAIFGIPAAYGRDGDKR